MGVAYGQRKSTERVRTCLPGVEGYSAMAAASTPTYEAFGLTVQSAFEVPELPAAASTVEEADVTVTEERIYLFQDRPSIDIQPLPADRQVMELVDNTYALGALGTDGQAAANFSTCGTVADTTSVKRLRRPRTLDSLPSVVERVQADLEPESC